MILETVVTIAAAILAAYIWETRIRDRVSVRRLSRQDDEDVEPLLDLYQKLFEDDGTNYSPEEILEFIDERFDQDRHVRADNIVLAAVYRHDVVGLLFCHFYPERRKAIISYYGVNPEVPEARRSASGKLLKKLKRILLNGDQPCDYVFFDLQGVDPSVPKGEARRRKARPVLFKQNAHRLGLPALLLQFAYVCPKVSLSPESREYPFSLMCVPVRATLPKPVPRELVLEFLRFLHLDCYGDLYPVSDERFKPYHEHLQQRLQHYESTLPPVVQAV